MPYEVLARRWRPQVFEDVIGQEHITQTLINAIKTERLAHAYLFGGPRGVGKTSVARILAKAINCTDGEPGVPCNRCVSCKEITNGSSVDVQEIDGASNRGIDEIRELRENIRYTPASSPYRVYIIDEVHMLTLPAFNALLKTLEEPPAHVKFIFATTESHKVPVTIHSRCQRFDFKRIPVKKILGHLQRIAEKEDIEISTSALTKIAREAEGSMRDAESLLDQVVSFAGPKVLDSHVIDILGVIDTDIVFEASRAILEGSPEKCVEIVDRVYNYGYDIKEFFRALMDQFRNLLISLIAPENHLLDMGERDKEEARRQAQTAGPEKLQILLNFLIHREEALRFTYHPRLVLETTMIKLCHLGDYLSFGDLMGKIERLEERFDTTFASREMPEATPRSALEARRFPPGQRNGHGEGEAGKQREATWDTFLTFLSSKSKAMFNILKDWELLNRTEGGFEIVKGHQTFSFSYFDDPEHYTQLVNYCRDFFGRDISIKIVDHSSSRSAGTAPQQVAEPSPKTPENQDISRPVRDILELFQGEILDNRPPKQTEPYDGLGAGRKEEVNK
jgi:DNA polymerase-3 subunit gamma/tau